jgi:lipoprotein-releasing system permease protein
VFLVPAIFWAMVSEKTRDIGILRAIGASRAGVAWLWLRYGLAIGIVGATLGGIVAFLIITNINAIHDWMGSALGLEIWNPKVYYFTEIPSEVQWDKAAIVLLGGVLASVVGALVPALKAANMHPVRALRFE